tara:strand:+ start:7747 stop:8109 length:363 start_codon:yes stop_codon:yes gene_type:complete
MKRPDRKAELWEIIVKLIESSEVKYKDGDFKGSLQQKRQAKNLIKDNYKKEEIEEKLKREFSKIYNSKYDLIRDHKKKIDNLRKNEIISMLEEKSEIRYQLGDYKGAVRAMRRSEKYYSN